MGWRTVPTMFMKQNRPEVSSAVIEYLRTTVAGGRCGPNGVRRLEAGPPAACRELRRRAGGTAAAPEVDVGRDGRLAPPRPHGVKQHARGARALHRGRLDQREVAPDERDVRGRVEDARADPSPLEVVDGGDDLLRLRREREEGREVRCERGPGGRGEAEGCVRGRQSVFPSARNEAVWGCAAARRRAGLSPTQGGARPASRTGVGGQREAAHDRVGVVQEAPGDARFALEEPGARPVGKTHVHPVPAPKGTHGGGLCVSRRGAAGRAHAWGQP